MACYVQFGCGQTCPDGWLNYDSSPRLRLERVPGIGRLWKARHGQIFPDNVRFGDIVAGLPVGTGDADGVFCSHVLEHLASDEVDVALAEAYRMLRKGGCFRLVVPDLLWRSERYVQAARAGDPDAADRFLLSSVFGRRGGIKTLQDLLGTAFGHSAHLWMFDEASLTKRLTNVGFVRIRRCELDDGADPMFSSVEDSSRFFDEGERELALEAFK